MKALVYTGPNSMDYMDFEDPTSDANNPLVKIDSVGICGSDMHGYQGHDARRPAPLILGHEAAGLIEADNNRRVSIIPLVTCRNCEYCDAGLENICQSRELISMKPRQGAFAEYISMPAHNLVEIPEATPLWQAALIEPLACGYHGVIEGVKLLRWSLADSDTLILGGGAIGVAAALTLKHMGAKFITFFEPNPARHAMLKKAVDCHVVGVDGLSNIDSPSLVIDAYGGEKSRETASNIVKAGGAISHIGLASAEGGLNIRRMTLQEIGFVGTYTFTHKEYKDTAKLLFDGHMGDFSWVEHRDLKDGNKAFEDLLAGRVEAAKIVLHP